MRGKKTTSTTTMMKKKMRKTTAMVGGREGGGGGVGDSSNKNKMKKHNNQTIIMAREGQTTHRAGGRWRLTTMMTTKRIMTARCSAGDRWRKEAVMIISIECEIQFAFYPPFLNSYVESLCIFCPCHFVKTPPDHGVRRSVAPTAHF